MEQVGRGGMATVFKAYGGLHIESLRYYATP
jgi:hypothetical protein